MTNEDLGHLITNMTKGFNDLSEAVIKKEDEVLKLPVWADYLLKSLIPILLLAVWAAIVLYFQVQDIERHGATQKDIGNVESKMDDLKTGANWSFAKNDENWKDFLREFKEYHSEGSIVLRKTYPVNIIRSVNINPISNHTNIAVIGDACLAYIHKNNRNLGWIPYKIEY